VPRRTREKPLFEQIAEEFTDLPLKVGVITSLVLAATGWAAPMLFPVVGLELTGYLAIVGRYVVWTLAALIFISASAGAIRRRLDGQRFESDVSLEDLSWAQFEGYLAAYFRKRGSTVTYRGGSSADGGVDLVLDDASGRRIVQVKHWKMQRVGVVELRALWGVREDEKARGAVFVTSGDFTPDARAFAVGKQLELIDGPQLRRLIAEAKGHEAKGLPALAATSAPCPQCGRGTLQRRLARRGANAGGYFLGCSRFPECRYTRNA
jgi:restriction system protein